MRDPAIGLVPDLRAGGPLVGRRVLRVPVLVRLERARDVAGEPRRDGVVALRRLGGDVRRAEDDLRAVRAQERLLLRRLLVRHHEDAAVALERGRDRQAVAGVAGRGLDDGPAGPQEAGPLGRLDHRQADAVLHGAARVEHLQLGQEQRPALDRSEVAGQARDPDERRVADEVDDRFGVLHRPEHTRRRALPEQVREAQGRACDAPAAVPRRDARPGPPPRSGRGTPRRAGAPRRAPRGRRGGQRIVPPEPGQVPGAYRRQDPDDDPAPQEQLMVAAEHDRARSAHRRAGRRSRVPPRSGAPSRRAPGGRTPGTGRTRRPRAGRRRRPPRASRTPGAARRRDRQDPADAPDHPSPERRARHRPRVAEEHEAGLGGKHEPHDERVDPRPVRQAGRDPAAGAAAVGVARKVLQPLHDDAEPERRRGEPPQRAQRPVRDARPRRRARRRARPGARGCRADPAPAPGACGSALQVPVEAAGPQEQPGEPAAKPSRVVRRVHGAGVQLDDDRAEHLLEPGGEPARELQLLAGPRRWRRPVPRVARAAPGRWSAAARGRPSAGRGTAPRCLPSRAGRWGRPSAARSAPPRCGTARSGRPARSRSPPASGRTPPPLRITARAEATCCSTPRPPRQTGSSPPSRWMSFSRQRRRERGRPAAEEPGSAAAGGSACIATNGSIHPRWAAAIRK